MCQGQHTARRAFLADMGMGFTGLALGAMLHDETRANDTTWAPPDGRPHFTPKAKNVIWLFMNGGVSHVESFDPKPMLTKYAGKTISETPFASTQDPKKLAIERLVVPDANGNQRNKLFLCRWDLENMAKVVSKSVTGSLTRPGMSTNSLL